MAISCIGTYYDGVEAIFAQLQTAQENSNQRSIDRLEAILTEVSIVVTMALIADEASVSSEVDENCTRLSELINYSA